MTTNTNPIWEPWMIWENEPAPADNSRHNSPTFREKKLKSNKPPSLRALSIRLTEGIYNKLSSTALENGRSRAGEVEYRLRKAFGV